MLGIIGGLGWLVELAFDELEVEAEDKDEFEVEIEIVELEFNNMGLELSDWFEGETEIEDGLAVMVGVELKVGDLGLEIGVLIDAGAEVCCLSCVVLGLVEVEVDVEVPTVGKAARLVIVFAFELWDCVKIGVDD